MKLRPTLALAILALGISASAAQATDPGYYLSDAAAFPISPLAGPPQPGEAGGPEYYLQVEVSEGRETRTLFKNGQDIERRIREDLPGGEIRESYYRGVILSEEARFGSGGLLLEESFFRALDGQAALRERQSYAYAGSRLLSVEAFGPDGTSIGRLGYRYDAAGRLAELRSSGSFGAGRSATLLASAAPLAAWSSEEETGLLRIERFDERGRPILEEMRLGGELKARESYRYGVEGGLSAILFEDLAAGTSRESSYGVEGRLSLVVERRGQKEGSRSDYSYDAEGRLILETTRRGGELLEKRYSYSPEGRLLLEETRSRGQVLRILRHETETEWIEELYENGAVFVRLHYKDGRKVLEEFLEGGRVVRTKAQP